MHRTMRGPGGYKTESRLHLSSSNCPFSGKMRLWGLQRALQLYLNIHLERLKLKLQYVGHLMRSANSLEKTLMLGKIEGRRRRG